MCDLDKKTIEKIVDNKYDDVKNVKAIIRNKCKGSNHADRLVSQQTGISRGKTLGLQDALRLLCLHDFKCFHCDCDLTLNDKETRLRQFTFDRINSDMIHSRNNLVCSCLSCNTSRKFERNPELSKLAVN